MNEKIRRLFAEQEKKLTEVFSAIEERELINSQKVLAAFQRHKISEMHFQSTSGYGYDDIGREALEKVYAEVFGSEDALVRHSIVHGTQAITRALFGVLRPGDTLLSACGKPYDTLEQAIGIKGKSGNGSLADFGVKYAQIELNQNGKIDIPAVCEYIRKNPVKAVLLQKSRGYCFRDSMTCEEIGQAIKAIKTVDETVVTIVDNCYGEFVETVEPPALGADLTVGSLIKNPGGGLAPSGGYVAGREQYVKMAAARFTSPGIGKEVGATLGNNKAMYQGLFLAPHTVAQGLKGAALSAAVLQELGFEVSPKPYDMRSCMIQAVKFNDREKMIQFCKGVQAGSPVDAHVTPEPWAMPGYSCDVIMAAGTFVQGATSEWSADGSVIPPYIVYMQGGLTYDYVKLGLAACVEKLLEEK